MEYRRRRRKRAQRQKRGNGAGKLVAVLLVSAAVVYLISASAAGTWLAKNVVAPFFTGIEEVLSQTDDVGETGEVGQQVSLVSNGETKKEEITLPGVTCYMLQMGVYSNRENAVAQSQALQSRGAGGYIIEDGDRYRVIASGYETETSLDSVREQLKAEGLDSAKYEVTASETVFIVTADETQLALVRNGFSALKEAQEKISELAITFDRDKMSVQEGQSAVKQILDPMEEKQKQLSSQQEQGDIIAQVLACYDACVSSVRSLYEYESESAVDFSAKIKYTHLHITNEYVKLTKSLSSTN